MASKTGAKSKRTDETPDQRFKRVGGKRVAKVLDGLDSIASAARSKTMAHSPAQADKIASLLDQGVARVKTALSAPKSGGAKKNVVEL